MNPLLRLSLTSMVMILSTAAMALPGASISGSWLSREDNSELIHNVVVNGHSMQESEVGNPLGFVVFIDSLSRAAADQGDKEPPTVSCTGVAISDDLILTAGHCLKKAASVKVKFFFSTNYSSDFEVIDAKTWAIHPGVNGGYSGEQLQKYRDDEAHKYHDIAVILLKRPSRFAEPISIARLDLDVQKVKTPQLYSFGRGRDELYIEKNTVEFLKIINPEYVGQKNMFFGDVENFENDFQALCWGDSGGPLTIVGTSPGNVKKHYLLGIFTMHSRAVEPENIRAAQKAAQTASASGLVARCGSRAYFTSVAYEFSWIQATEANLRKLGQ